MVLQTKPRKTPILLDFPTCCHFECEILENRENESLLYKIFDFGRL